MQWLYCPCQCIGTQTLGGVLEARRVLEEQGDLGVTPQLCCLHLGPSRGVLVLGGTSPGPLPEEHQQGGAVEAGGS